jgi:hypothetical protein
VKKVKEQFGVISSSMQPLAADLLASDVKIVIVRGSSLGESSASALAGTFGEVVSSVFDAFRPSTALSMRMEKAGLRLERCTAYAYADKDLGTSTGLNDLLRELHAQLKNNAPKGINTDIQTQYSDSPNRPPELCILLRFNLTEAGEQAGRQEFIEESKTPNRITFKRD